MESLVSIGNGNGHIFDEINQLDSQEISWTLRKENMNNCTYSAKYHQDTFCSCRTLVFLVNRTCLCDRMYFQHYMCKLRIYSWFVWYIFPVGDLKVTSVGSVKLHNLVSLLYVYCTFMTSPIYDELKVLGEFAQIR